jgi:surface polysaccharide O-acyltransferase-like enzyme
MAYGPEWWYVVDPDQDVAWTMLVLLVDVPNMQALFFVAGFLALPSLIRRGPGGFVREKLVRLGLPWVFGVVFLAPMITYLTFVSRGTQGPYLEFWAGDFWGPWFQQAVYWFLGVLLVLFLLLAWTWAASERLQASRVRVARPPGRLFVAFVLLTAAGSALLSPAHAIDDWRPLGWFLVVQPARIAFYVGFFALGVYAERRGWFVGAGWRPEIGPWVWAAVIAGITYLAFRMNGYPATILERSISSLLFAAFCLAGVMAGLAVFQRWGNGAGRAWRLLADNSFGIYYLHPLVLYPLALALVGVALPSFLKVAILVVVTVAVSLAFTALVLRRVPGLRRIF